MGSGVAKKAPLICIAAGMFALFGVLVYLSSKSWERPAVRQPPLRNAGREYGVVEQWTSVAQESKLPEGITNRITTLMEQTLQRRGHTKRTTLHLDIRPSLREFLQQFRHKFGNPQERDGFSYWLVWLVAEAVERKQVPKDVLHRANKEFGEYLEGLVNRMCFDFQKQLGPDFSKFENHIGKGIEWTKDTLMQRFEILQADPLFPAFKGPLNRAAFDMAMETVLSPKRYPKYEEPKEMMILKEEAYVGLLEEFFKNCPTLILYEAARREIQPRIWKNPYWGPMEFYMASTPREWIWPMEVVFQTSEEPSTSLGNKGQNQTDD